MSDKVAIIASILKPVDDTRMYEKLARSIRESNKYRVNIIGFGVKKPPSCPGVTHHCLYQGQRTGFGRLLAPWRFLNKLTRMRPDLMIVCSPELLLPAVLYKITSGCRLWYDVQENYQRNISYQSAYPKLLKPLLKATLWLLEHGSRPFVDHYLLAEKGYVQELTFTKNRSTVLENKFVPPAANVPKQSRDWFQLVFTGTCSRENGILEAIALAEALIKNSYPIRLDIVGQVPDAGILREIRKRAGLYENGTIQLIGDGQLVQHQTIMEYAANADFGLVAYQPNPSNQNCIPTKIYEYLGLRLPMLLQTHPLWVSLVNPYNAALVLDFNQYQPDEVWKELHNAKFYTTLPGPEISWEQEAQKLIMVLS